MNWGPYLRRCFTGGVGLAAIFAGVFLFCWLLFRMSKLLRWLKKTPGERQKQKQQKKHPLSRVSGRGRVAYLILCLERAVHHYGLENWDGVLDRLWGLTATTENVGFPQLFRVCAILPVNILPYERSEDLALDLQREDLNDFFDGKPGVTEDEFQYLKNLYQSAGWRLCVLDPLLQAVYKVTAASWVEGREEFDGLVMDLVEQSENLLEGWEIGLPQIPEALLNQTGSGWGKPFRREDFHITNP